VSAAHDARLLLLSPADDVLVARVALPAGARVALGGGAEAVLEAGLPLGHKLARHAIAEGARVLKYGLPIGRATRAIAPGEPVHVHNLRSEWTPTHTLEAARARAGEP
jgi:hypothetical protein